MEYPDIGKRSDWQQVAAEMRESQRPDIEKLAHMFDWITRRIVEQGLRDTEVARALRDEDTLIKNQIKTETIRHAREVFQTCHMVATGRRAWDEK
jgi:hypothetical protein